MKYFAHQRLYSKVNFGGLKKALTKHMQSYIKLD